MTHKAYKVWFGVGVIFVGTVMPLTNRSRKVGVIKAENQTKTQVIPPGIRTNTEVCAKHSSFGHQSRDTGAREGRRSHLFGIFFLLHYFLVFSALKQSPSSLLSFGDQRLMTTDRTGWCKTGHCISQKTEGEQPKQRERPRSFSDTFNI